MSPTALSISASVGSTTSTVPSDNRFEAAAIASARTGADAPLRRRVGDCSPVSRMTPVSSERNASDGALDILLYAAESDQPSFLFSHTIQDRRRRVALRKGNPDDPAAAGFDDVAADNGVLSPVCALHENVGLDQR